MPLGGSASLRPHKNTVSARAMPCKGELKQYKFFLQWPMKYLLKACLSREARILLPLDEFSIHSATDLMMLWILLSEVCCSSQSIIQFHWCIRKNHSGKEPACRHVWLDVLGRLSMLFVCEIKYIDLHLEEGLPMSVLHKCTQLVTWHFSCTYSKY